MLFEKQCSQLSDIIEIINGDLTPNDRKKLITLCTVDVHARDVVQRLRDDKAESAACFQWQSQLRYVYNTQVQDMQVCRDHSAALSMTTGCTSIHRNIGLLGVSTCSQRLHRSAYAMQTSPTSTNTSAIAAACASRPSPTGATSRSHKRSGWCWGGRLQGLRVGRWHR